MTNKTSFFDILQPRSDATDRIYDLCVQIENILNSYDDKFDAFAELIQNSVDAILERHEDDKAFTPRIDISVDYRKNMLSVLDNGCGVEGKDLHDVLRPNCSLKRRLRQSNARGEKGAAVAFLQFGHREFQFQSKTGADRNSYLLKDGDRWFQEVTDKLASDTWNENDLPSPSFTLSQAIDDTLDSLDRGSLASVEFSDSSNLPRISTLFGNDKKAAIARLEYVLRTRTAIGFVYLAADRSDLPKCIAELVINLEMVLEDGSKITNQISPGFLYPHEIADREGNRASLLSDPRDQSELLYDFLTEEFVKKHFPEIWQKYSLIFKKYSPTGYLSYAFNNSYYEDLTEVFLDIGESETPKLTEEIIQINGGFQVAVREYPNGRRHSFLQRGGSEDKSRSFIVLNFGGNYKPDYGRKNLSHEVRNFVNDFCKALMKYATKKERKEKLKAGKGTSPHGIRNLREARKTLAEQAEQEKKRGHWTISGEGTYVRKPSTENEVIVEFVQHVMAGRLPGFKLYGVPSKLQLDGLFDYELPKDNAFKFNKHGNILGIQFSSEDDGISEESLWLEFKISSDKLIENFNLREGDESKKYFVLVDLLVCFQVDDDVVGYRVKEISEEEGLPERSFFGATHLLICETDRSHVIPVICLADLRDHFKNA